ncbi:hypothetical protein SARC_08422 [Sphaeroforma arctica JP610]|uniref:Uncharacterized protein n=1 Tax=Sphaeroforma arctica JP610 TaxID=667725 RepID=A0A0L0FT84_9EUKA|nr:hypothetical protein SARC_08422 [Sphaeroforma arctica JP610]KNC79173.1 hypothetical protein SARC_08422 [Sphaeroforma arctica JP610]|eukprot:XP_014153075.1 hypothetical protein SARC_08422 [Sphaeroforma arctica JP610]
MDDAATVTGYVWPDVEYGYIAQQYVPSATVQHLHAMPRIAADSTFDATQWAYVRGLIYITIPFMVLGLVMLVGTLVFMCRCGSGSGYHMSGRVEQPSTRACIKASSVVLALLTIGACGVAIYGDVLMAQGIDLFTNTYTNATDIIADIESMAPQVETVALAAVDILEDVSELCPDTSETIEGAVAVVTAGSAQVVQELNNVVERVGEFYTNAEDYQDKLSTICLAQQIVLCAFFALMALLSLVVVNTVFVSPALLEDTVPFELSDRYALFKGCRAWLRVFLLPLSVMVVVLAFVAVAASFFVTIGAVDFCIAPDEYISAQLATNVEERLSYYIHGCDGVNPNTQLIEDSAQWMVQAEDLLWAQVDGTDNCPANAHDDYTDLMTRLNQTVDVGLQLVNSARGYVSCRTVNGIYSEAVHSAGCASVMDGLLFLWAGALVCSVAFAVTVMVYPRYVTTSLQAMEDKWESTTSVTGLKEKTGTCPGSEGWDEAWRNL